MRRKWSIVDDLIKTISEMIRNLAEDSYITRGKNPLDKVGTQGEESPQRRAACFTLVFLVPSSGGICQVAEC